LIDFIVASKGERIANPLEMGEWEAGEYQPKIG